MTLVVGHAGHWLVQLVYLAPLVFMGGLFAASHLRRRREAQDEKSSSA